MGRLGIAICTLHLISAQARLARNKSNVPNLSSKSLISYCLSIYCDLYQGLKTNWTDFAAKTFLGQYFQGEDQLSKRLEDKVDAIVEFYFKNGIEFESQEGFKNLTDAFGDSGFLYGTHLMAEYDFLFLILVCYII